MRIILLGPPGAGKGTQGELLVKQYSVPHISTGEILRAAIAEGTEMGMLAKEYMEKGELVPEDVVVGIVRERLAQNDKKGSFMLDGFPRTVRQAEALDAILLSSGLSLTAVINVDGEMEGLMERLTGRRVCKGCGATYHIKYNSPKVRNVCDKCGTELYQRTDDSVETVKQRLQVYREKTAPLIEYYQKKGTLFSVDGSRSIEDVSEEINMILNNLS